jgi:hypothetical protein
MKKLNEKIKKANRELAEQTVKHEKEKFAQQKADAFDIEENIKDCDISYRGGNLKIDVSSLFPYIDEPIMGAYQNYLGGGIAGSIHGGSMFQKEELHEDDMPVFDALNERIKKFFYDVNNGGGDDYMQENVTGKDAGGYEKTQSMPARGY